MPKDKAYEAVSGTWRLYESGDAPEGDKYVIKSVETNPAQTITFSSRGRFKARGYDPSFISLYGPIRTYKIDKVENAANLYSFSYWDKRANQGQGMKIRQGVELKSDTLRLTPLCYEGCHFAFVRVK
ncbi:hypothetical protein ACFSUS_07975 [Spirosoma soli]|uniref:Lipocalin-like domain-containing protein n=1 Tax=Spirosoma soli TaxID=1770529 RepID=A0ABW5M0U2_9BACT